MRLFIAIDFKELENYFVFLQNLFPKDAAKIKPVSSFHLTLKFLGKVPETEVESIKSKLKNVKFVPFSANLDDIGFFPNENYIRVVWVGVQPIKEISRLQQEIESELKDLFKKDEKFHPHITLSRVKSIEDKQGFIETMKKIEVDNKKKIEVKKFKLIKSSLTPLGPIYEDLEAFG